MRAGPKLEQRDLGDLFTLGKPGRRCKTGDWRGGVGVEGEEHCVVFLDQGKVGGFFGRTKMRSS
jgi:hypothetical protein